MRAGRPGPCCWSSPAAQALRLARTCTLSGLTPDQALDAAARLLEEGPSAGEASQ